MLSSSSPVEPQLIRCSLSLSRLQSDQLHVPVRTVGTAELGPSAGDRDFETRGGLLPGEVEEEGDSGGASRPKQDARLRPQVLTADVIWVGHQAQHVCSTDLPRESGEFLIIPPHSFYAFCLFSLWHFVEERQAIFRNGLQA